MKERPILFSSEMVRAILDGRKTQTRRAVKGMALDWLQPGMFSPGFVASPDNYMSPYGFAGDRLWVRETWRCEERGEYGIDGVAYRADGCFREIENTPSAAEAWMEAYRETEKWRPSIFMPQWASRITLEIVNMRVERLQDISKEDAKAEGVSNCWKWDKERNARHPEHFGRGVLNPYIANYSVLWDEINGKGAWDLNPWVWVIEFKRVEVSS